MSFRQAWSSSIRPGCRSSHQVKVPNLYSFRIRVMRSPTNSLKVPERELDLNFEGSGCTRLVLKGGRRGTDEGIDKSAHFALVGDGFATEDDARTTGQRLKSALMVALARQRVGADFGARSAGGMWFAQGLKMLEASHGQRVLNDVHGLMVYETEPQPLFVTSQATILITSPPDVFRRNFQTAAASTTAPLDEASELPFTLFNASFFEANQDGRFLMLMMSIEAMLRPAKRTSSAQGHVDELIAMTQSAASLSTEDKASMVGSLKWLHQESISQAGRKLARTLHESRTYLDLPAPKFFTHCYALRSAMVHGTTAFPSRDTIATVVAQLEVFVADLLSDALLPACPPSQQAPRPTEGGDAKAEIAGDVHRSSSESEVRRRKGARVWVAAELAILVALVLAFLAGTQLR